MKTAYPLFAAIFVAAVSPPLRAQSYTWTLLAGQPPLPGSTDGAAGAARFYNPNSLVADPAGNLYVTDTFNHTVRRIAADGTVSTLAGTPRTSGRTDGTGAAARFYSPNGIAIDAAGSLYVADRSNHAIRRITPGGVVTTFAGLAGTSGTADGPAVEARFNLPAAVGFDAEGRLWVADEGNHAIRRVSADGTVATIAGLPGTPGTLDGLGDTARFRFPSGILAIGGGEVLVADSGNHTIRRLSRDGAVTTIAGSPGVRGTASGTGAAARFSYPTGLTADASGNVYIADASNDCIRRLTPAGAVSTFAGSPDVRGSANGTGTTARFYSPFGVAYAPDGNLYVADTLNHTIRRITPSQAVSNHAGPGGGFGNINGTGSAARFNYPQNLAIDEDGILYVADWRNNAVRRITPGGAVTTALSAPSPHGIAVGGGVLAVSNRSTHVIRAVILDSPGFVDIGLAGQSGATDGPYASVLFNQPHGLAIDDRGRLLIADTGNHSIRFMYSDGEGLRVITLAGLSGSSGSANGIFTDARFNLPRGLTVDHGANIYVADSGNHTIRKITPQLAVTTVAGSAGNPGAVNGTGAAARFSAPNAIAVDAAGNLYVADTGNHAIRRITPDGVVTALGGAPGAWGFAEGTGTAARFDEPTGIAIDAAGVLYVVSSGANVIMRGALDSPPVITAQPQATVVAIDATLSLAVSASGGGLSYQWKRDGTSLPGATAPTLTIPRAQVSDSGRYTVEISNSAGAIASDAATVSVQASVQASRIVNLAIRSQAGTGAETLIVGVGIGGGGTQGTQPLLIRGVGPTLGAFGVAGVLNDPQLSLYAGANRVNENDNWGGDSQVAAVAGRVGAFALPNPASRDAALYLPALASGSYSVQLTGGTGGGGGVTGVVLAEIYDATAPGSASPTTPRLTNVSARTHVGTDGDILIAGFVLAGETSRNVLIRAIGPTLGTFGVTSALADPKLELFGRHGKITENDNWGGTPQLSSTFFSVGAFSLSASSRDAALLISLAPGSYTAQISGVNNTTGVALVEVYEVP